MGLDPKLGGMAAEAGIKNGRHGVVWAHETRPLPSRTHPSHRATTAAEPDEPGPVIVHILSAVEHEKLRKRVLGPLLQAVVDHEAERGEHTQQSTATPCASCWRNARRGARRPSPAGSRRIAQLRTTASKRGGRPDLRWRRRRPRRGDHEQREQARRRPDRPRARLEDGPKSCLTYIYSGAPVASVTCRRGELRHHAGAEPPDWERGQEAHRPLNAETPKPGRDHAGHLNRLTLRTATSSRSPERRAANGRPGPGRARRRDPDPVTEPVRARQQRLTR